MHFEIFVFLTNFFKSFLQEKILIMNLLKPLLKFHNLVIVAIEERDQGHLKLIHDRMGPNGFIKLCVLLSRSDVELVVDKLQFLA